MSNSNDLRTARGHEAIDLHPDYPAGIDADTAASDIIADVLHAVIGLSPLVNPNDYVMGSLDYVTNKHPEISRAADLLDRSLRSWIGDTEDEDDELEPRDPVTEGS